MSRDINQLLLKAIRALDDLTLYRQEAKDLEEDVDMGLAICDIAAHSLTGVYELTYYKK